MKRHTHAYCKEDIVEENIVLFKKGKSYRITGFDYVSLLYYVEPEYYEDSTLPDEFVISPVQKEFTFYTP